jgi:hypothetical protein
VARCAKRFHAVAVDAEPAPGANRKHDLVSDAVGQLVARGISFSRLGASARLFGERCSRL